MSVTAVPIRPTKRIYYIWLWLAVAIALLGAFALARAGDNFLMRNAREAGVKTTPSGLQYKVIDGGKGPHPTDSDVALINYTGKLLDGTTFDKSEQPTPLGVNKAVPGFSEGLKLMRKGAKYRFWIKPSLGYGDKAAGPIPANSTLAFDVELVDFLPEALIREMQQQQMMNGGGGAGGPPGAGLPGGPPGDDTAPPLPKGAK